MVGLGRVYVQTGRIDQALRTFGEAIKMHPKHMPAWHYNGMAHMMSNDPKQAAESWEHILKVQPDYAKQFSLDRRAAVARKMAAGR
jgi:cytochrome c-type biogenesis protein CcmH/NrfG